jgi:hypothetical protein
MIYCCWFGFNNFLGDKYPTQGQILFILEAIYQQAALLLPTYDLGNPFRRVIKDFQQEITNIWLALPTDTLVAALLDPRFKSLHYIDTQAERDEAWKCLQTEFDKINADRPAILPAPQQLVAPDPLKKGDKARQNALEFFGQFHKPVDQLSEIARYRLVEQVGLAEDPLTWWKLHRMFFDDCFSCNISIC